MASLWEHTNPQLRDLAVYEPGKPIEETARELGSDPRAIIKLASNENPLGPSGKALAAMHAALESAHLYPDGGGFYLRQALATKLNVAYGNLILGNGSNEVIEFIAHVFLRPGDEVITAQHAFVVYKLIAAVFGAETVEVPAIRYGHDLDAMLAAVTSRTRLIFIANPNNPTGTLLSQQQIDAFIERVPPDVLVVVDEAYFEYVDGPPDTLKFVREGRNVVVLRTFSKIAGLANVRIGYAIAPAELIRIMQKPRQPFNTNGIAQAGALASLADTAHQDETKRITDAGRTYLQAEFEAMGLEYVPSFANFVLVRVGDGARVFKALLSKGIIVRALSGYDLNEWVRISVGTADQNAKCIAALREVLPALHRA